MVSSIVGKNSANIKNCLIIYGSLSDTLTKGVLQLQGMAFANEICLVVSNNGVSKANINVQMFQYYDCECPGGVERETITTAAEHHTVLCVLYPSTLCY